MTDELEEENEEVKSKYLKMQIRLLKSKLQPQIIAEGEEGRRSWVEVTLDPVQVHCAVDDDDWNIWKRADWRVITRMIPCPLGSHN